MPTKYVSWFNIWAAALGTVVLLITTILLPIKASPNINSANDIFTLMYNQTGWPTGWAFCMTLLAPTWAPSGYDVAAHVAEETYDAARNVPRAMIWSTWSSVFLGFIYLISLAICTTDIDSLMWDPLGQPIGTLLGQVVGVTGGVVLLSVTFVCQVAGGVAFVRHLQWHEINTEACFPQCSLSSPPASSLPTAATRRSRGTPGLATSPSAHTHRTTPHSLYSSSRPPLAPSPSAPIPPSRRSSPGRPSLARSGTSFPCLGGACTRITTSMRMDHITLVAGAGRSGGWRSRGMCSFCRWLACECDGWMAPPSSRFILTNAVV